MIRLVSFARGSLIGGKYVVERTLGEGGMGTVVAAEHRQLGHRVAIKFLHPDLAQDPSLVERFVREARACVQLDSPHICRVSDIDALDDGRPYIIMEWLWGDDLSALARKGTLPLRKICDYLAQACDGLAEAHAVGIIHRDLKPGNLFLHRRDDGSELIKVLDFGIAKVPGRKMNEITQTGVLMGSPSYMAPEQLISSKDVDPRTDIWSLGVILYELVTGTRPFQGDTFLDIQIAIANQPPAPLPPKTPPALATIILRCLERDPSRRFADATSLGAALRAAIPTLPVNMTQALELASTMDIAQTLDLPQDTLDEDTAVAQAPAMPGAHSITPLASPMLSPPVMTPPPATLPVAAPYAPPPAPPLPMPVPPVYSPPPAPAGDISTVGRGAVGLSAAPAAKSRLPVVAVAVVAIVAGIVVGSFAMRDRTPAAAAQPADAAVAVEEPADAAIQVAAPVDALAVEPTDATSVAVEAVVDAGTKPTSVDAGITTVRNRADAGVRIKIKHTEPTDEDIENRRH